MGPLNKYQSIRLKLFLKYAHKLDPNFHLKDLKKYEDFYYDYIRTLDVIQLNWEFRDCCSNWKQDRILRLARFYKEEYNEDWL